MKIKVQVFREDNQLYAIPKCHKSRLICKTIQKRYLSSYDVKRLELMGYEVIACNKLGK